MRRALGFLTPLGGPTTPSPGALAWFPLVGAGLGLALGGVWWLADHVWAAPVAAAVVVAADLALTGMLHFDGLVDSADGLLPPLEPERRLEVMADPATGAFGVGVAVAVLLLRWASLAALTPSPVLLAALWCASRLGMAHTARNVPYARSQGLASAFLEPGRQGLPVVGVLLGAVLVGLGGADAVVGVAVLAMSSAGVVALAVRRVGGFTGDVLGAAGMVGETAGLLAAAARW
ncbi:MAG TPA: adenosylcobinamide-GDP ribazoletransferase [Acidimicrobiales bacterium]|nr:adenosylcobinamide-GDP ribazoletransferase [Acidimicrobiales bacterium]